jgi:hypothetical protein
MKAKSLFRETVAKGEGDEVLLISSQSGCEKKRRIKALADDDTNKHKRGKKPAKGEDTNN